jgi:hypothetical protein
MSRRVVRLFHLAVLLGLFIVPAVQLDCDPSPLKQVGDFADEGLWTHNARCKVLFGNLAPDDLSLSLVAAPLFAGAEWLIFSACGVSYFSARLVCVASLWLILLMVYVLMGRRFSWGAGLLAAAVLGVAHEMLMYTKWATPVMPEMMFLTAVLFFWELGRTGSRRWMAVSGACLVAALLTKMTSLQFLPAVTVFLAGSYWLRRDVDRRRLLYFAGSAGVLGLLAGLCYLYFFQSCLFVSRNLWQSVWTFHHFQPKDLCSQLKDLCLALMHIWFVAPMILPGGLVLTMLFSLWVLDFLVKSLRGGVGRALREISTVEFYSLCWLVGSLLVLVVVPYKPDRRFAMLAVPLTLLAVSFAAKSLGWGSGAARPHVPPATLALSWWWRAVLGIVTVAVWCRYSYKAVAALRQEWFCLTEPSGLGAGFLIAAAACLAVGVLYFMLRKPQGTVKVLLAAFFLVSFTLDGIWYAGASYTIRDLSKALGEKSPPGQYITGQWAYELCLENRRMPLLCNWQGGPMNRWFVDHNDKLSFTVFVLDSLAERPRTDDMHQCPIERFPPPRVQRLEAIQLCPVIFSPTTYRVRGRVYAVQPQRP